MAITEDLLMAGRRSVHSYKISILKEINRLNERLDNTDDYQERMEITQELYRCHKNCKPS